jgi:hypothetical protein
VSTAPTLRRTRASKPLAIRWSEPENPPPVRALRPSGHRRAALPGSAAPPWLPSGEPGKPFDFCGHMRRLCQDVVVRCPELAHIDVARLLFGVTQARNGHSHGLQARVTPLRFPEGRVTRDRNGVTYQVQRFFLGETEFLYLMTFCLPRFLEQSFDDKFITVFHELFHIGPHFDGDLRRHNGRYALHSRSQKGYDEHMANLARGYLADRPDPELHSFLRLDFGQLEARHGSVVGVLVPRPKIIPLSESWAGAGPEPTPSAMRHPS